MYTKEGSAKRRIIFVALLCGVCVVSFAVYGTLLPAKLFTDDKELDKIDQGFEVLEELREEVYEMEGA